MIGYFYRSQLFKQLVGESISSASDSLGISHFLSLGGVMLIPYFTDLYDLTLLTVVQIKLLSCCPRCSISFQCSVHDGGGCNMESIV